MSPNSKEGLLEVEEDRVLGGIVREGFVDL